MQPEKFHNYTSKLNTIFRHRQKIRLLWTRVYIPVKQKIIDAWANDRNFADDAFKRILFIYLIVCVMEIFPVSVPNDRK